ncbi:microtubule associated protein-domain-containing protein [Phascolomyces articulosus]|uniref:Microtubule associated protein-domain-containing protein n=1 Tax=Phascolomyces articulosus TaxID=60185 RepID=A0AAD5K8X3_9FUNG|nr:microtubule associated protein-domain-containing protein [Phascolomyces articulosus]
MECLHSKIDKLNYIWSITGSPLDSVTVSQKLQYVYYELDRLIENEQLERRLLSADIEDIMENIDYSCNILGVSIENILTSDLCKEGLFGDAMIPFTSLSHPTFARQKSLFELDSRLTHEIYSRRSHVKDWLNQITLLSIELGEYNPFKPYQEYEYELSWGTVQSISCALRDLLHIQATRRYDFEESVRLIHYYWTTLDIFPDESNTIDHALNRLFSTVPVDTNTFSMDLLPSLPLSLLPDNSNNNNDPTFSLATNKHPNDDEHESTTVSTEQWIYYNAVDDNYLRSTESIELLKQKATELSKIYNHRLELYNKYVKSIHTIYEEIKTPIERRCVIRRSLSSTYLKELRDEFDALKEVVRKMAEEYIDKFREKLEDLWDKALLTQKERAEFIAKLHEKADTMDEVHLLVDEHIKFLQRVQPKASAVARLMKQRKELIQKMIDFEKTASNPKRLFQSSFQLVEEEKFRKTCFPTLLMLDDSLVQAVQEFERVSGKYFIYDHCRYLDTLRDEIADRAAMQTFFGFLNTDPKQSSSALTRQTSRSKLRTTSLNISPSATTSSSSSSSASKGQNNTSLSTAATVNTSLTGVKNKCPPSPTQPQAPPKRRSYTSARSATTPYKSELASPRTSKSAYTSQLLSNSKLMPPTPPAEPVPKHEYMNSNNNNNKRSRIPYAVKIKQEDLTSNNHTTTTTTTLTTPTTTPTATITTRDQQQRLSPNSENQWNGLSAEEQNSQSNSSSSGEDDDDEHEQALEEPLSYSSDDHREPSTPTKQLSNIETSSVSAVSTC